MADDILPPGDRRCRYCGGSVENESYESWLFSIHPYCAIEVREWVVGPKRRKVWA